MPRNLTTRACAGGEFSAINLTENFKYIDETTPT